MPRINSRYLCRRAEQLSTPGLPLRIKARNGMYAVVMPTGEGGGYRQLCEFTTTRGCSLWLQGFATAAQLMGVV